MQIVCHAPGIGDTVALSALIRACKRHYPLEPIRLKTAKHGELFFHNPLVGGTGKDYLPAVVVYSGVVGNDEHPIAVGYGAQVGIKVIDPTPEVYLTDDEKTVGRTIALVPFQRISRDRTLRRIVAIDTWATWPSRQWPMEGWRRLLPSLKSMGYMVVEVGKETRDEMGMTNDERLNADLQLYGKTSLRELAAILSECDLFIGNDAGTGHLAAAVGTPQVVIYGPKKWWTRAYWNTTPVYSLRACNPACGVAKNGYRCVEPPERNCRQDIQPEDVLDAVNLAVRRFPKNVIPTIKEKLNV